VSEHKHAVVLPWTLTLILFFVFVSQYFHQTLTGSTSCDAEGILPSSAISRLSVLARNSWYFSSFDLLMLSETN